MSDDLLPYYDRELGFLRHMGAEFAKAHPKVAGRLRLGSDSVEDPHVSRLIESVAFLNARIRQKLDDDLPELTDALLGVVSPHHLAPIPSMAVVQFKGAKEATAGYQVRRGQSLSSDRAYGTPCRFRTCYDTTVWPLVIDQARVIGTPFRAPTTRRSSTAAGVLHLVLKTTKGQCPISDLDIDELRFFLVGQPTHVHELYELIFHHVTDVALASSVSDNDPHVLGKDAIRQVGFARHEAVLPYTGRSHPGYRLLTEYFAFPAKFLFFDVKGLRSRQMKRIGDELHLFLYLDHASPELEHGVSADSFALGCTPVINLFERRAEPIELNHQQSEYHLLPDARDVDANELYSIDSVRAVSRDGRDRDYRPFYGINHETSEDSAYWFATRRDTPRASETKDSRTEVYISLVDLDFDPAAPEDWILETRVTCLNGDLPSRLPFGGGEPKLAFSEGGGGISEVRCLTPPTSTLRPPRQKRAMWRAISQLSLNHLSLVGGEEGTAALREILRVHDVARSAENRSIIGAVADVTSRNAVLRQAFEGRQGFSQGTEVTVTLEDGRLRASGAYLFASLLERFFGGYCAINSFVQLVCKFKDREEEIRWKPRAGDQSLV